MKDFWFRWRGEWRAILAIGVLTFVIVGAIAVKRSGQVNLETGKIVRFGSYASDLGNRPTVIAVMTNGQQNEIMATPALLSGCSVGSKILIARRPHSLAVAPSGCR